jgi:hypothetical protein
MCLLIEITLPGVAREQAGRLSREAARRDLLELQAQRVPKDQTGARYFLGAPGEGCACSLLGDNADWNEPFFELDEKALPKLRETLEFIAEHAGATGFTLRAAWLDGAWEDAPKGPVRRAKLQGLLADVAAARIAANVTYQISSVKP